MDTDASDISSSTSRDDLTELYTQSGVPIPYETRHTKTGFLVSSPRLQGYVPTPPGKKELRSWVWKHGEAITRESDGQNSYLCRICYDNAPSKPPITTPTNSTQIIRHLQTHGFDNKGNQLATANMAKKACQNNIANLLKRQADAQSSSFDRDDFKRTFVEWAVIDDISLRQTSSKRLRGLVTYRNPFLEAVLPEAHTTTRRWIVTAAQRAKAAVCDSLATAKSRITISFDGWKSDNRLDMLGVIAHYMDSEYQVKNVLLALRNMYGSHCAETIHHHLLTVCDEYQISNKISYFIADNASNNDSALQMLETDLNIDSSKQRLRCVAHIINLVTKAILYGTDVDCINDVLRGREDDETVSRFEDIMHSKDELSTLKAWRKKGPIGKLHNLVVHIKRTPKRRECFRQKQKEANGDDIRLYELVLNGGVRWNSTCEMISRTLDQKDALSLYQTEYQDNEDDDHPLTDDCLTSDDWSELKELHTLLIPLRECSKTVQFDGTDTGKGSLYQSLQALDFLLTKLEDLRQQHIHLPNTHFKASINLGWKKLDKYYTLTDDTPAYRAAIVLHPHFKMRWFEEHWSEHLDWIDTAKKAVNELFSEYKRRHRDEALNTAAAAVTQSTKDLSEFEKHNRTRAAQYQGDELQRYLSEPHELEDVDPLQWWQVNQSRYPVLRHMAFDLFATPASSSADERIFSEAGHVLDEGHFHTKDDLAEAHQCLKSAVKQGLRFTLKEDNEGQTPQTPHLSIITL